MKPWLGFHNLYSWFRILPGYFFDYYIPDNLLNYETSWESHYNERGILTKAVKRINFKSSHCKEKKLFCNCVWWRMWTTFIVAVISQYKHMSNHYVVYLKLIQCYMSIIYQLGKKSKVFSWKRKKVCGGVERQGGEKASEVAVWEMRGSWCRTWSSIGQTGRTVGLW